MYSTCRVCGKPLSDFTSVKLGIGPVCRGSRAKDTDRQGKLFMPNHAEFSIIEETDDYIYIKDTTDGKPCMSVTNDAAWVVSRINTSGKKLFYMDTCGNIDELYHENGVFKGFRPGHGNYNLRGVLKDADMPL